MNNVEEWETDKLIEYASNPRENNQAVDAVSAAIHQFGFRVPILVKSDGLIVDGHLRLKAAKKLNLEKVPVIVVDDMTDIQIKAFRISINKMADLAEWNDELLALELKALGDSAELTGFTEDELLSLLGGDLNNGLTDDDAVPEVPDDPINKRGDIWLLGNHRVMCGDSTSVDDVEKLMDGNKADMVFTSPPYNANAKTGDGDIFNKKKAKKMYEGAYSDNKDSLEYVDFVKSVLEICFINTDGFIFWNVSYNANSKHEYIKQLSDRIDYLVEQVCWKKSSTIPFKGCLMRDWEPVYIFSTNKQGLNLQSVCSNYWDVNNTNSQQENHKACFPVALPEKGISLVVSNTGIVLDPFGGSGSTLIACEKTNRNCRMMELDERYSDVIVKRWQDFTGKQATLESTGETFNAASR